MSAQRTTESESRQVFQMLEPILKNTLTEFDQQDSDKVDSPSYVMTLTLLGFNYEFLGKSRDAIEFYSRGLQLDPNNDVLLVARGILLYGSSARAISDLEMAIQYGSTLSWPFVLLAHHSLLTGRFEDCRKLCERALTMNGSAAVMSEVSEWIAIAQAELGFPAEMVRVSFENAIRHDPSNERARRNLAVFEATNEPVSNNTWETRSESAVRTSSLAERRFEMPAVIAA